MKPLIANCLAFILTLKQCEGLSSFFNLKIILRHYFALSLYSFLNNYMLVKWYPGTCFTMTVHSNYSAPHWQDTITITTIKVNSGTVLITFLIINAVKNRGRSK